MSSRYTIRAATPADAGAVTDLLEASFPALLRGSYDEALLRAALPLMTRANPALLKSGTFYLAQSREGAIVGCGGWTAERPGSGVIEEGLAHIRHFATHSQWTGCGVGRALYAQCERTARTAGVHKFECYATLNAEGFYAALGFKTIRPMEVPMAADVIMPSLLMTRTL